MYYASGTSLLRFPESGVVVTRELIDQGVQKLDPDAEPVKDQVPILGLLQSKGNDIVNGQGTATSASTVHPGRVVVYGDSNCLDSSHLQKGTLLK